MNLYPNDLTVFKFSSNPVTMIEKELSKVAVIKQSRNENMASHIKKYVRENIRVGNI